MDAYLNTYTGKFYTYDELYNYLLNEYVDEEARGEGYSLWEDPTLDTLLEVIDSSLEDLGFTWLSPKAVEKLTSSAANDCHCKKKSTDSSILDSPLFNGPMPMGVFDDSYSNTTNPKEKIKETETLTGKDLLEIIEEIQVEEFKSAIGTKLTDKEKANAKNKVPNFYCGFIDDKEMEKSIKQLLNKMAQK